MVDALRDLYLSFIDQILVDTLKGKFRSKRQVYDRLVAQLELGASELFERCLDDTTTALQRQSETETDELKQAKLTRKLRAIKTLQGAWEDWQANNQVKQAATDAVQRLLAVAPEDRLSTLMSQLDVNRGKTFNQSHLQQLAADLNAMAQQQTDEAIAHDLQQLATGLTQGIATYLGLEEYLISWMYEQQRQIGFAASSENSGPWALWAKQTASALPKAVFSAQAQRQSVATVIRQAGATESSAWVELAVVLQGLQRGLVAWFDAQPYNFRAGQNLAGMTLLAFTILWGELSNGCRQLSDQQRGQGLAKLCFTLSLQTLRTFAQRDNFPLYGGVFTSFSGEGFQDAMTYLDQPLSAVEQTQEKARILTVLGYSQRWLNRHQEAIALHQQALELAQDAGDQYCEVANLNHLARLALYRSDYGRATSLAQRALIVARSHGDRKGEANALASVGYSEVMTIRQQEAVTSEQLQRPLQYLEQGKGLAEKQQDIQSQSFCGVGLGITYLSLERYLDAHDAIAACLPSLQQLGDPDLRAASYAILGEACYQLDRSEQALVAACLGMYWLHERDNKAWVQTAALVVILRGQLGEAKWTQILQKHRSTFLTQIGADGFDYLPQLLEDYRAG